MLVFTAGICMLKTYVRFRVTRSVQRILYDMHSHDYRDIRVIRKTRSTN